MGPAGARHAGRLHRPPGGGAGRRRAAPPPGGASSGGAGIPPGAVGPGGGPEGPGVGIGCGRPRGGRDHPGRRHRLGQGGGIALELAGGRPEGRGLPRAGGRGGGGAPAGVSAAGAGGGDGARVGADCHVCGVRGPAPGQPGSHRLGHGEHRGRGALPRRGGAAHGEPVVGHGGPPGVELGGGVPGRPPPQRDRRGRCPRRGRHADGAGLGGGRGLRAGGQRGGHAGLPRCRGGVLVGAVALDGAAAAARRWAVAGTESEHNVAASPGRRGPEEERET